MSPDFEALYDYLVDPESNVSLTLSFMRLCEPDWWREGER